MKKAKLKYLLVLLTVVVIVGFVLKNEFVSTTKSQKDVVGRMEKQKRQEYEPDVLPCDLNPPVEDVPYESVKQDSGVVLCEFPVDEDLLDEDDDDLFYEHTDEPVNDKTIFVRVEKMPEYPGGIQALLKFVRKNAKYPKEAADKGIQGKVYLKLVVEKTGEVGEVEILRSPHELLSKEAIRVVKMLPKFQPGMRKGEVVRVWYQVPVAFRLPVHEEKSKTEKTQE